MKVKFTTLDIKVLVSELKKKLTGMRVNNVYDIDSKTYLIRLTRTDEKAVLLLESGIRLHTTDFEWPKNVIPSGFAMKLRKHLKGRRLESIEQLGVDRIIDMQFGSGEAAYHVILEMYDRGNIVLTDYEYMILNIQRPRTDNNQDVKFIVKEKYPIHLAKHHEGVPTEESILEILASAKPGDNLKKVLVPHLAYGGHLIEHCLLEVGLKASAKINSEFQPKKDIENIMKAILMAEEMMEMSCETSVHGYIINQKEKKVGISGALPEEVLIYSEFHPFLFKQHANDSHIEFESFDKAVDEFFSKIESQKQDRKLLQQENTAIKKLEHIKSDNQDRVKGLKEEQLNDMKRAWLIELNLDLVDEAIGLMRNALAHQLDWTELKTMMEEVAGSNQVVGCIKALKLDTNHINMLLKPPEKLGMEDVDGLSLGPMKIDIDLGISAYANARKYYDMKRHAAMKEMKTSDALQKAYKSAEKKTMQVLKEVHTVATINKARKTHWFEKFLWFISSENYVVIGGRDQQQNELIVKRYLKPGDIYVHADLHGASSVIIKNPSKNPIPPVTLNEAGTMALCNSAAWEAKVVTSSWWVYHDQVSKTAPTGEYLTTGSFMIRGKKNYLLPSSLIYGFGFLFKVDEPFVERHRNERRVKGITDEAEEVAAETVEVELKENEDDDDNDGGDQIKEKNDDDDDDVKTKCENQGETMEGGNKDRAVDDDDDVDYVNEGEENSKDDDHEDEKEGNDDNKRNHDDDDDGRNPIEENGKEEEDDDDDDCEMSNVPAESVGNDEVVETFPDTQIKLDHLTSVESDVRSEDAGEKKSARMSAKQRRDAKKGGDKNDKGGLSKAENVPKEGSTNSSVLKRGQKSKLKKIKEKYGDQDDEERKLRIQLLASDRAPKEDKSKKKSKGGSKQQQQTASQKSSLKKQQVNNLKQTQKIGDVVLVEESKEVNIDGALSEMQKLDQDDIDQEDDIKQVQQETDMLDSLTGIPYPDDVLLYCVPVCAPWNALTNYRFKVKLMPGTSKRGKAAKMVISMFMQDKSTTQLEKDLLRSIKDTDLSRNMPGKVKVSVTKSLHKK